MLGERSGLIFLAPYLSQQDELLLRGRSDESWHITEVQQNADLM